MATRRLSVWSRRSFGFGYLFGFADQFLRVAGLTDEVQVMAQLTLILNRVFGKEQGPKIFGKCLRKQNDSEFRAAKRSALRSFSQRCGRHFNLRGMPFE